MSVGFHQGCPLSPVLAITFMDRISSYSQLTEGPEFSSGRISPLLLADVVVLLASSNNSLQLLPGWFAAECEAAGIKICLKPCFSTTKRGCKPQDGQQALSQSREIWSRRSTGASGGRHSEVDILLVHCGEEVVKSEGEALDSPVELCSNSYLWS